MKVYLEPDGGLVIGQSVITRNSSVEFLYSADNLRVRIAPINGSHLFYGAITDLTDSEDASYANRAAFETATKDFFFRVGGSVISFVTTSDGQYLPYMTDPNDSTKKTRIGVRNGNLVLDITLTATGFDGNESTDGGVSGDWVNVTGS